MGGKPEGAYSFPLAPTIPTELAVSRADELEEILRGLEARGRHPARPDPPPRSRRCFADGTMRPCCIWRGPEPILSPDDLERRYDRGLRSVGARLEPREQVCGGRRRFAFPPRPTPGRG